MQYKIIKLGNVLIIFKCYDVSEADSTSIISFKKLGWIVLNWTH
jgi:hypothetical protein